MGVKLNCDTCGKFIRDIKPQEIAKMRTDEEVTCDKCLEKIGKWSKAIERAGNEEIAYIKNEIAQAKARFQKVLEDKLIQDGRS